MVAEMYRSAPFACRIVLLAGYLDDDNYQRMIALTSYVVNTSYGEGQCLPLMEFMSAGKPAVAPNSSAMADYITTANAFVVASSREMTCWPHDPRQAYRTYRYRIDFESLVHAFKTSYSVRTDQRRYESMSSCALNSLREHCSDEVLVDKFMAFLSASELVPGRTVDPEARLFASASLGTGSNDFCTG
jgi:glycosyltransferase involved in cell wall biosynthesis